MKRPTSQELVDFLICLESMNLKKKKVKKERKHLLALNANCFSYQKLVATHHHNHHQSIQ
jgi:hypothetical protein